MLACLSKFKFELFNQFFFCNSGTQHCFLLQALSSGERRKILLDIADALEANEKLIKNENDADVADAEEAGYERPLIARLALKPGKVGGGQLQAFFNLPLLLCVFSSL